MTEDLRAQRAARGRRVRGLGRPFAFLVVTLALVLVGIPSAPALGSSSAPTLTIPLPLGLPPISLPGLGVANGQGGGAPTASAPAPVPAAAGSKPGNPFSGRAMWIWELSASSRGDVSAVISQAKQYGVRTLIIKSSDGTSPWTQFSRPLITEFRDAGLHVCAWQYVYGQNPADEARLGAGAVREGASCLVIDAEAEYQGRYYAAQKYMSTLREDVGTNFPIGLAGLPYVDYHPAFPYSVFLGPGGAQYNLPQMYWRDIGTTVDDVYSHTYMYNRLYQRPIYPLGQVFQNPPLGQIIRFRQLASAYGAPGVSWWDYQESTAASWHGIAVPTARPAGFIPDPQVAAIGRGWQGDVVVWAQEHLYAAGDRVSIDGVFGPATQVAVESFQVAHSLSPTGVIDVDTWRALLRYRPVHVHWKAHTNRNGIARVAAVSPGTPPPRSASLPGRNELRGDLGQGR